MYSCTTLLATFKDTALFFVCKRTVSEMKSCISSILKSTESISPSYHPDWQCNFDANSFNGEKRGLCGNGQQPIQTMIWSINLLDIHELKINNYGRSEENHV